MMEHKNKAYGNIGDDDGYCYYLALYWSMFPLPVQSLELSFGLPMWFFNHAVPFLSCFSHNGISSENIKTSFLYAGLSGYIQPFRRNTQPFNDDIKYGSLGIRAHYCWSKCGGGIFHNIWPDSGGISGVGNIHCILLSAVLLYQAYNRSGTGNSRNLVPRLEESAGYNVKSIFHTLSG